MDWSAYPNFSPDEFRCSHCGVEHMQAEFLDKLQQLRFAYGKPIIINSGYRCPEHSIEANKVSPGAHTSGCAADIAVDGHDAYRLLRLAFHFGFTGIGIQQKGGGRFIHLDTLNVAPRPNVWSY